MGRLVLCVLATLLAWVAGNFPGPLVVTQQGTLRGTYDVSANGRTYAAFLGIPYARPPVGKQRFKEPVIIKPWRGVWNAMTFGPECMQFEWDGGVTGDEDCLYLNVFTPSLNGTGLYSVIVYIHGGGFMQGGGHNYGPKYLLDNDVVYVTLNYRLGILGFFSTGDAIVPGNNGLKDQVLALQWVQKNIAMFGGDPNRVTLTGTSAGGVSAHLHYLSPLSTGLFYQGMSPSGSALSCWGQAEDLQRKGEMLAALVGCPTFSTKDQIDCLRHRPARTIVEQLKHFTVWGGSTPFSPWGPTVEIARPEAFLSEQPVDILMEGRAQSLPWVTSITTEEGLYPAANFLGCPKKMAELETRWEELAALIMDWNSTVPVGQRQAVAQRAKQFYLADKPISNASAELIQMIGDRLFVVDVERAARIHASHHTAPVYFYVFGYRGKHSLSEYMSKTDTNWGSSHADDTLYILNSPKFAIMDETEDDRAMSKIMVDMWVNFAQTSNPSPWPEVAWAPLQPHAKEMSYLWLGNTTDIEMRSSLDLGHRHFWDSLTIREPQIYGGRTLHMPDEL